MTLEYQLGFGDGSSSYEAQGSYQQCQAQHFVRRQTLHDRIDRVEALGGLGGGRQQGRQGGPVKY